MKKLIERSALNMSYCQKSTFNLVSKEAYCDFDSLYDKRCATRNNNDDDDDNNDTPNPLIYWFLVEKMFTFCALLPLVASCWLAIFNWNNANKAQFRWVFSQFSSKKICGGFFFLVSETWEAQRQYSHIDDDNTKMT